MPTLKKIQSSFNAGVFSPTTWSRIDIDKYQFALKECKNFIIHPHGAVSNRPGTYFVASTKDDNKTCRIFPFIFSLDQAYIIEFGEEYIRFFTDGAQITQSSAAYEIVSPYQESDLEDLKIESSADTIYIMHPLYQTRVLGRYGNTDWRLSLFENENGPFMPENIENISLHASAVTGSAISLISSSAVFDPDHVGSIWRLRHYIEGQADTTTFSSATTGGSIRCFTTWRLITHGTWTGKLKIEKSTDGGNTWTMLRAFTSANDNNVNTSGTEDIELNEEPFLVRMNMYDFGSGTCTADLTTDPFNQEGIFEATTYNNATALTGSVLTDFGSTDDTLNWAEGSWSEKNGWPRVARFTQGDRLAFGGTEAEPQTDWISKTSQYTNFGRNIISSLDTDAISQNLPTRQLNAINGMAVLQRLIVFTAASEWAIGASDGSPLTPTNAPQNIQGYNGSSGIDPVLIGNEAVFMQGRGNVVRNLKFSFQDDGYTGSELNILARHLFEGYSIKEMVYQQEPDRIVWCLRSDGKLLALTYMPEQDVVAWAWHETEGEIESIAVIPADGYDELWMVVSRETGRFVERMAKRMASEDVRYQYFVDCGIGYDNSVDITNVTFASAAVVSGFMDTGLLTEEEPFLDAITIEAPIVVTAPSHELSDGDVITISDVVGTTEINGNTYKVEIINSNQFFLVVNTPTGVYVDGDGYSSYVSGGVFRAYFTTFSGLDHLEGMTVAILGDGNVFPQQVVTDGAITLDVGCQIVQVGLPYESDLETLPVELALRDGTMQGRKIKISEVKMFRIKSRGGFLGSSFDDLHEVFHPTVSEFNEAPVLETGVSVGEDLGGEYIEQSTICFRQEDPLPVTIGYITYDISIGG